MRNLQPQSSSSNSNNSVLTVSVTGSNGPCYYQWQQYKEQRNGTMEWSHLSYGTESTYTPKESGTYRVIVYDEAGNVVISDSAEIYGSYPLVIVEQPKDDLTTPFGSSLATGFIVRVAGGQPPYSYQWYYCEPGETTFHVYEGKTSDNITIVASWSSDFINKPGYRFKCVITDQAGASVTSDIVRLGKEDPLAAGDKTKQTTHESTTQPETTVAPSSSSNMVEKSDVLNAITNRFSSMGLSKVPLHNVGLDAAAEALLSGRYSNLNDAIDNCSSLMVVERPDAHTTRTHIVHEIDATYTNENGLMGVDGTALFRLIMGHLAYSDYGVAISGNNVKIITYSPGYEEVVDREGAD